MDPIVGAAAAAAVASAATGDAAAGCAGGAATDAAAAPAGVGGDGGGEGTEHALAEQALGEQTADGGGRRRGEKKKRAYLLTFGYIGTGYRGSQYNPGVRTVEGVLLDAVHRAGGISDVNMEQGDSGLSTLQRISWMRSSRTDKGVHARVNAVSLKLVEQAVSDAEFVRRVNAALPADSGIVVYEAARVTNSFHAQHAVCARTYAYVLPTYALTHDYAAHFDEASAALTPPADQLEGGADYDDDEEDGDVDGDDGGPPAKRRRRPGDGVHPSARASKVVAVYKTVPEEIWEGLRRYRITPEARARADAVMAQYVGTHYFHNFTKGRAVGDASTQRYITQFGITDVREEEGGFELATITVKGASFMLNQIRRMIGASIAVTLGRLGDDVIPGLLSQKAVRPVPTAPPDGLLLHALHFDRYNKKLSALKSQKCAGMDGLRLLDLAAESAAMDEMAPRIRHAVIRRERDARVAARWIRTLPHCLHQYWGSDMHAGLRAAPGSSGGAGAAPGGGGDAGG